MYIKTLFNVFLDSDSKFYDVLIFEETKEMKR